MEGSWFEEERVLLEARGYGVALLQQLQALLAFENLLLARAHLPHAGDRVQIELLRQMVQWMQAVALGINKEAHDEQDHR